MTGMFIDKMFILLLCLACLVVYFNSLSNDFVFDDLALIVYNPMIKSLKLLPLVFKKDIYAYFRVDRVETFDIAYRPMQLVTYYCDYKLWGLNPLGFRLLNILLHLLNSILIYYLFLGLFANKKIAGITGILFLVHPIHTSVVSYIAGRAQLLSCIFMLLSMLLFLKFINLRTKKYLVFSLIAALLALISREDALILFIFIALILFIKKTRPKDYSWLLYFIALDLVYLYLRFLIFDKAGISGHPHIFSLPLLAVNFLNIIPRYISLLLLPLDLHMLRVTPYIFSLIDLRVLFSSLLILSCIFIIYRLRKNRIVIFGILWFLVAIAPVFFYLDGYPLLGGAMMAESWAYIASIGIFAVFANIFCALNKTGRAIFFSFVVFYGLLTISNNIYWKNDLLLHKRIVQYNPGKNQIRRDLVNDYLFYGLYEQARSEIEKFASFEPQSPYLDTLWGNYYFYTGKLDSAIERYNRAIGQDKHFFTYYRLSLCYSKLGQIDRAIYFGLESFRINPHFVLNLIQLGDLYQKAKMHEQAKVYYRMAYEINPHNKALRDLLNY